MNTKRMRSRYHRSGNGGSRHQNGQTTLNRNHVFDSNGPDVRIRGTAQQLHEKYLQHGRDALSSGDRIAAESFFQYAEHYSRILNMMNQSSQQQRHRPQNQQQNSAQDNNADDVKDAKSEGEEENSEQRVENSEIPETTSSEISDAIVEPVVVTESVEEKPARPAVRRGRPPRTDKRKVVQEESN